MPSKIPVIHTRLDEKTLSLIDLELERLNRINVARPYTRSSWIREQILGALRLRAKKIKGKLATTFKCIVCGRKKTVGEISHKMDTLLGHTEYTCFSCANGKTA
jgi:hypothetical protein